MSNKIKVAHEALQCGAVTSAAELFADFLVKLTSVVFGRRAVFKMRNG